MACNRIVQRNIVSLMGLALLAACATSRPAISPTVEARHYQEDARNNYTPPGTAADPWGSYIIEASTRFDVPEHWVRQVIQMESGGNEYMNGRLTTSVTGAMGLMQVEPETYDELRVAYHLGSDPYDPHNNILAGTAYLRELYNQFGTPGFLAAYNAGPKRLTEYLAGEISLPNETRHYVAVIGSQLGNEMPLNRSPNDELAFNFLPVNVPSGRRRRNSATVMLASNGGYDPPKRNSGEGEVASSNLAPPVPPEPPAAMVASNTQRRSSFSIFSSAYADTPAQTAPGGPSIWGIQVGAFADRGLARAATVAAKQEAPSHLARAATRIASVERGSHVIYRARLAGLTREQAQGACEALGRNHTSCIVVSPDSMT